MSVTGAGHDELETIAAEYRHVLEEHRRAGPESSARRHARARLDDLERRFERLLSERTTDPEHRIRWRAHLQRGAPAPGRPAQPLPLVFRGVATTGSLLEVRERPGGEYEVIVDGALVERVDARLDFSSAEPPCEFRLDGLVFRERFSASAGAVEALGDYVTGRIREPPWAFSAELRADGLIGDHFGVTPRGHRALRSPAST